MIATLGTIPYVMDAPSSSLPPSTPIPPHPSLATPDRECQLAGQPQTLIPVPGVERTRHTDTGSSMTLDHRAKKHTKKRCPFNRLERDPPPLPPSQLELYSNRSA